MKANRKPYGLIPVLCLILSCAGAPKPTEAPPPASEPPKVEAPKTAVPTQAAIDNLAAAKSRAEKSRKEAFELEAPEFFPDDWKTADASFVKGGELATTADKDAAACAGATEAYTAAAVAFEDLSKRSLPKYAETSRDRIAKARELAVKAGVPDLWADRLAIADKSAEAALAALDASADRIAAIPAVLAARDAYLALAAAADAVSVRKALDDNNFKSADPGNYDIADGKLNEGLAAFDAATIAVSKGSSEEALLRFRLALKKGFELLAGDREKKATTARTSAKDAKANVAAAAAFDAATATYDKAATEYKAENFEVASGLYADSEKGFKDAETASLEKRARAEAARKAAEEKLSASEQKAKKADAVLEGGK